MSKNLKVGFIIGGIVLLIVLPLVIGLTTGWEACEYTTGGYSMMGGFGFAWFMPIIGIATLGLIIWAVFALAKGAFGTGTQGSGNQISALETLKNRYARGEIGKEEFEEKRKDLVQ